MRESTLRCWPARGNHKSSNEMRIYAARAEMRTWLGSAVMSSESESEAPLSAWAEAMLAEGYDPAGYLVASEGLQRDHRNFQDQLRAADQLATDTAAATRDT